jgi:hypothetical protein
MNLKFRTHKGESSILTRWQGIFVILELLARETIIEVDYGPFESVPCCLPGTCKTQLVNCLSLNECNCIRELVSTVPQLERTNCNCVERRCGSFPTDPVNQLQMPPGVRKWGRWNQMCVACCCIWSKAPPPRLGQATRILKRLRVRNPTTITSLRSASPSTAPTR